MQRILLKEFSLEKQLNHGKDTEFDGLSIAAIELRRGWAPFSIGVCWNEKRTFSHYSVSLFSFSTSLQQSVAPPSVPACRIVKIPDWSNGPAQEHEQI